MDGDRPPPEEGVAAIYSGIVTVFLALLSAAQEAAPYSQIFILAPGIRLLLLLCAAGWVAVVWAMASGRASASTEQIVVLAAFSYAALAEVNKDMGLINRVEWDYDLFAGVAWAQLLATNREARELDARLATASRVQLQHDIRSQYVRLVAAPTVALPSAWCRLVYLFFLMQGRPRPLPASSSPTAGADERQADSEPAAEAGAVAPTTRLGVRSVFRAISDLAGSWDPRSVYFGLLRLSLVLTSAPLILLFFGSLLTQYLRGYLALRYKVEAPLAQCLARRWLRDSLLAPPDFFPKGRAWTLWMLASAVNEPRARHLIRCMTCPPDRPLDDWTDKAAKTALGDTCGAERYRGNRPPRSLAWRVARYILFFPLRRWRLVNPTYRELFFKFTLAALNVAEVRNEPGPPVCTMDHVINGDVDHLRALYRTKKGVVLARWTELQADLVTSGILPSSDGAGVGNGVSPPVEDVEAGPPPSASVGGGGSGNQGDGL